MRSIDQNKRWLPVVGWEGLYEISSDGEVRSKERFHANRNYGGKPLKLILKKKLGYLCVTLQSNNRERKQALVQHLVLEAFVGPRPEGFQACHNNGIRIDNRLDNLRWDSVAANQADKVIHGTSLRGQRGPHSKLTEELVRYIRTSEKNQPTLASELGVSQVLISKVRLRKTWKHVN